jgi:hypothetical protein
MVSRTGQRGTQAEDASRQSLLSLLSHTPFQVPFGEVQIHLFDFKKVSTRIEKQRRTINALESILAPVSAMEQGRFAVNKEIGNLAMLVVDLMQNCTADCLQEGFGSLASAFCDRNFWIAQIKLEAGR